MATLIDSFSIDRIKSSGAIFDVKKLIWFNQQYIKNSDSEALLNLINHMVPTEWNLKIEMIDLLKDSVETLNDFKDQLNSFFVYSPIKISSDNHLFSDTIYNFLNLLKEVLSKQDDINANIFKDLINNIKKEHAISGNIWKPIRIALTGAEHGPDISSYASILGSKTCVNRIQLFLDLNVD